MDKSSIVMIKKSNEWSSRLKTWYSWMNNTYLECMKKIALDKEVALIYFYFTGCTCDDCQEQWEPIMEQSNYSHSHHTKQHTILAISIPSKYQDDWKQYIND